MKLAQEMRLITDTAIAKRIEEENKKNIDTMKSLAASGFHYVIYPTTKLSNSFIIYLEKEQFKLYGRLNSTKPWRRTYSTEDIFPTYNEIMIMW